MQDHESTSSDLVSFDRFLSDKGKTRVTGYRWRKLGLIAVVNIFGRLYVSRGEIAKFEQRATAGEFARTANIPLRAA